MELSLKYIPGIPNNKCLLICLWIIYATMLVSQKILRVIGTQNSAGGTLNSWNLPKEKEYIWLTLNHSTRTKFLPLILISGNLGSAHITKLNKRTRQGGYGYIALFIKPRSDSSFLRIRCKAGQKWSMLLVRHQTYLNIVILISMSWFGTIQGSIPTSITKIGIWSDG